MTAHDLQAEDLLTHRADVLEKLGLAWDACDAARASRASMLPGVRVAGFEAFGVFTKHKRSRERAIEECRRELDRRIWYHLLTSTELGALMGSRGRERFERLVELKTPPVTSESVERLLLTLDEQRDTIFARMVADVFELLHPRHRRDRAMNFDHKLIAYGVMDRVGMGSRVERLLMDLSTILRTLDGASLPTHDSSIYGALVEAFETDSNFDPVSGEVENGYMRVKWFKNRNLHIWLLREDLRVKMDGLLASHLEDEAEVSP